MISKKKNMSLTGVIATFFILVQLFTIVLPPLKVFGAEDDNKIYIKAVENFEVFEGGPTVNTYDDLALEKKSDALAMKEKDIVKWFFNVDKSGKYFMQIKYLPLKGKSNEIETKLLINGNLPADGMEMVSFKRVFENANEPFIDESGNERRPSQKESEVFNNYTVRGKLENSFCVIDLKAGKNEIEIEVLRETFAIETFCFIPEESLLSYEEYSHQFKDSEKSHAGTVYIEAEKAKYKSDASLYSVADRSSVDTSPAHYFKNLLNSIGGTNWRFVNQWIDWEVDVEEDGLYQMNLRFKQNHRQGQSSNRKIYIDGKVPFKEFENVDFNFNSKWQTQSISSDEEPYYVYLSKGKHTLRLENTIGDVAEIVMDTTKLVSQLNELYRNVLVYVGSSPDPDRDYQLDKLMPDLKEQLRENISLTEEIMNRFSEEAKRDGQDYSQFLKLKEMLERFYKNVTKLPIQFALFRSTISSVSAWLLTSQEQPLLIDYIEFASPKTEETINGSGEESGFKRFCRQLLFDTKAFFASFFVDYSTISTKDSKKDYITVWMGSTGTQAAGTAGGTAAGRDQAMALKNLIDNDFEQKYGIDVDLKLVDINSVIPAVATGNGPDVTLSLASRSIMDYGFRGALYDLTQFPDYKEVLENFYSEASVPFEFDNHLYALPESYSFNIMFYRKDILKDLNIEIPQTWGDIYKILPKLNNNHMTFGIPSLSVTSGDNLDIFTSILYQNNENAYTNDGRGTNFASKVGIGAFNQWADFYTKYKVPDKIDTLTYFRTGQAPIVIAPYTFYNNLAAGAPEIDGLWGATIVPGTMRDGVVDHTVVAGSTGSVIFENAKNPEHAWSFLKWWLSEDVQYEFGLEIEGFLGKSGRIATANIKAFERLPWASEAESVIRTQMNNSKAMPEVPGGYMSTRYICTAMRLVVNNNIYPRDALVDYNSLIEQEIILKRKEFKLDE